MIVLQEQPFRVTSYHKKINPEHAGAELSQGLVLDVLLAFEDWLGGDALQAEAFLDPGADHTLISQRWIDEQAKQYRSLEPTPWIAPNGRILERVHLSIDKWRVPLGLPEKPIWLLEQDYGPDDPASLPGYEDLLLGRDFLSQHGLLVVIDGEGRDFSVLVPGDSENRQRRDQIRDLLNPAAKKTRSGSG
jgi:hypothetical protein